MHLHRNHLFMCIVSESKITYMENIFISTLFAVINRAIDPATNKLDNLLSKK